MPYLTGSGVSTLLRYSLRLSVPQEDWFLNAVKGAISDLTNAYNWEKLGSDSVQDCVDAATVMWGLMESEGLFSLVGSIIPFATSSVPTNTLECDGAVYNRVDYPELYAVLDSVFIIDADTFMVPMLQGYVVMGAGAEIPNWGQIDVGSSGGTYEHQLNVGEIPAHSHDIDDHNHAEHSATVGAGVVGEIPAIVTEPSVDYTDYASLTVGETGDSGYHNNVQPFLGLRYCIVAR